VWDALISAGTDLGVGPFGVEAQRILRLEKGHAIVGQDTDGLTQAFSAGLDWAVKLDKPDFAGATELRWQREEGPQTQLVALQPVDSGVVPPEASQIVSATSRILGRITSSRYSPTLDRGICLAQLRADQAVPGNLVRVLLPDGRTIEARVCADLAHVDAEGVRVRA
jgi:sarcosine oxidase subunit alpha